MEKTIAEYLIEDLSTRMSSKTDVLLLQYISYLEGRRTNINELISCVNKFKSGFVLRPDDWSLETNEEYIRLKFNKFIRLERSKKINKILYE